MEECPAPPECLRGIRQLLQRVLFIGLYAALITGGAAEFERLLGPYEELWRRARTGEGAGGGAIIA